jgi:hypothetical protein
MAQLHDNFMQRRHKKTAGVMRRNPKDRSCIEQSREKQQLVDTIMLAAERVRTSPDCADNAP